MLEELKEFTHWDDAARWLAKHGWGLGLIEQQKEAWDADKASTEVKPVEKAKTVEKAKPAPKKEADSIKSATAE